MKRREAIAAAAGVGVLGAGAYYAGWGRGGGGERPEPVVLETIDAPGSDAGEVTIPGDRPMLVEFFTTTCDVCASYMPELAAAHERLAPGVAFVSVTNQAIGMAVEIEDVRSWWTDHDGAWTVALDPDLSLTDELDVSVVPTTVLFDADGVVRWRHRGEKPAAELVETVEDTLDVRD